MNAHLDDVVFSSQERSAAPAAGSAAHAAAPRLDLYAPIHKALRFMMSVTLTTLGNVDVADERDLRAALAGLDALLDLCASHVGHENAFMHTAILARAPARPLKTADDHVEHLQSIDALRAEAATLRTAALRERAPLAQRLYRHLALFVAENFQHMQIEETVNNAALWAHYSDEELAALHDRLLATIGPDENLQVARWMAAALNPHECSVVFGHAKASLPREAFDGAVGFIRPQLDERALRKFDAAIG